MILILIFMSMNMLHFSQKLVEYVSLRIVGLNIT
ncbi:hypothetical protein SAMN05421858_4518 [Haladaptatus litoreus]|uniref:Uncharacterized protein n=1 Tax=Haladaptatus litoreus TaxID=553468 RepID=A0A1N7EUV5_9EURY|nr:hypothetical protein SAMN05421858_4518 [Haladaptatus litoreus]